MRHQPIRGLHHFFTTSPMPCPYLPDRMERRVMTELNGRDVDQFHDALSLSGFRRSHSIAYAPTCPGCRACIPIRVRVPDFMPSRTQRRIEKINATLHWRECDPIATLEQYDLFSRYQSQRHNDGEMSRMDFADYQALVEETPVETAVVEFRNSDGVLVGVCLTDHICDGLSAVYSFFDPAMQKNSLGTYMVVWLIRRASSLKLSYVYLGFWIEESPKMAYKSNFVTCEIFQNGSWSAL